ncbi:MAG: polysaccharide deacetylase family protein [Patescibacteria group bacterium]
MLKITTSWDDGDVLDERVMQLLEKYGLKGTFYIPRDYWGERLSDERIRELSEKFEIGAHTLTHADLTKLSLEEAEREIRGSRKWLEEVTGKPVEIFCYPRGRYTPAVRELVTKARFRGARTTKQFSLTVGDPFEMETTVHVYPLPVRFSAGIRRIFGPIRERYPGYRSLGVSIFDMRSFESAAKASFDTALARGGIFHLWGHSWEIEKYGLWEAFERVCAYIGNRADCRYVTNAELV